MNYRLSHTIDSGVCYFTQEVLRLKKREMKWNEKLLVWNFAPFHTSYYIWLLLNFGRNIVKKKLDSLTHKLQLYHSIITHIYDNHIIFEVSLHFWRIWPSVCRWDPHDMNWLGSSERTNNIFAVCICNFFLSCAKKTKNLENFNTFCSTTCLISWYPIV